MKYLFTKYKKQESNRTYCEDDSSKNKSIAFFGLFFFNNFLSFWRISPFQFFLTHKFKSLINHKKTNSYNIYWKFNLLQIIGKKKLPTKVNVFLAYLRGYPETLRSIKNTINFFCSAYETTICIFFIAIY